MSLEITREEKKQIYEIKKKIQTYILDINAIEDRPTKQKMAVGMFEFLKEDGMLLIEKDPRFKVLAIEKCKEFLKLENPDLSQACQNLLESLVPGAKLLEETKN